MVSYLRSLQVPENPADSVCLGLFPGAYTGRPIRRAGIHPPEIFRRCVVVTDRGKVGD